MNSRLSLFGGLAAVALLLLASTTEAAPRYKRLGLKVAPPSKRLPAEVEKAVKRVFPAPARITGWTLEEKGWATLDSATVARTAQALARTHVPLVPTLAMHEGISRMSDTTVGTHPTMADVPLSAAVVRDVAERMSAAVEHAFVEYAFELEGELKEIRGMLGATLTLLGTSNAKKLWKPGDDLD